MTEVPEDRRLFREAADLAIRLQNDPSNPVSVEMLRAWLARSAQHQAAWARISAIHGMTGQVLKENRRAARAGHGPSRRSLVIGGAIGLGAAAAGSLALPRALRRLQADYTTSTAELRPVVLTDGSVMTLGPDSAVAIRYGGERRAVELLSGMAYFEVAPEPARPFVVHVDRFSATALGTAFDVSNDAGFISVSVSHGVVEASTAGPGQRSAERLNIGQWITLDSSSHAISRGLREPSQIAAWRDGMIVADRETVSAMVAKIARWQGGHVVMADPSLGSRQVSGVFDLSDPIRALEAVARPFGAKVRRIGPLVTVLSPV
ncbi:FecR family protein [Enterovirga rhinocerotis]|uniref:FecR family protein n=1 Tax=Enterovirga rhinocerotis TaxID=1339210 RepID=A0A4R7BT17_9HYPH|nr:FecR domain-containing protein [Enterovirga rhinocerotis]TDR88894.1 FecR family protein [Enterovirga rhinocerotis]